MDNTKLAMDLLRTVDQLYPLTNLRRSEFREQSAKRWAIFEYVSSLLDKPAQDPIILLEMMIGRLACMVSHISLSDNDSMIFPYKCALSTLINLEEKLNS